jgi:hypothetical protein
MAGIDSSDASSVHFEYQKTYMSLTYSYCYKEYQPMVDAGIYDAAGDANKRSGMIISLPDE